MKLQEIKSAVEAGKTVHWSNTGYVVIKDRIGQWLIHCTMNDHYIGLTWRDGKTMNGSPEQFFIAPQSAAHEFLEKHPDAEMHENCLVDIACPECGNRGEFRVAVETVCAITDNGTDPVGDRHWDRNSWMLCQQCSHEGMAQEFIFEGLDALIRERRANARNQSQ